MFASLLEQLVGRKKDDVVDGTFVNDKFSFMKFLNVPGMQYSICRNSSFLSAEVIERKFMPYLLHIQWL